MIRKCEKQNSLQAYVSEEEIRPVAALVLCYTDWT